MKVKFVYTKIGYRGLLFESIMDGSEINEIRKRLTEEQAVDEIIDFSYLREFDSKL